MGHTKDNFKEKVELSTKALNEINDKKEKYSKLAFYLELFSEYEVLSKNNNRVKVSICLLVKCMRGIWQLWIMLMNH